MSSKAFASIDTNFTITSKAFDQDGDFAELYMFKWTTCQLLFFVDRKICS
ncbi:hypothetical protein Scep_027563 [Stephania cephalantha]|uniref:Uncharacterized protein n=1 Tax=Stephania cephalantha TaxID=152367 RepID=A0AAP0E8C8_9MAGN